VNLIFIVLDSLRQDHVSFYNPVDPVFDRVPNCATPNIAEFARHAIVFNNMYPCGLPTIPTRTELMTGQFTLPSRGWQPLVPTDITIAQILRREGYVCGLISDNYHYRAPGMNFHREFNAYEFIRGQEYDPYSSAPPERPVEDYVTAAYPRLWRSRVSQFLANTDHARDEKDRFTRRLIDRACDWLTRNRSHSNVFCWVDSFDPHEPWDPPPRFDTYTVPDYKGKRLIMPMGGEAAEWATDDDIRYIRGLYAGEVAFVDDCLEQLFECLKTNGYFDDSVVVLMADHGHPLADHGKFLKGADRMYSELLRIPFMIRMPDKAGRETGALAQFPDVLPTMLELLGIETAGHAMHGMSFKPILDGDSESHRKAVISGYHEAIDRCIRDEKWSYIQRPNGRDDELYNLSMDPKETCNVIAGNSDEAMRLSSLFGSYWRKKYSPFKKGIQGEHEVASGVVE
jgi:arylsulfatase A-like enzyme